jgi:predicted subunit of tRNA(5-methylaminomethyl-2-thiouridylate) methyltransferase
VCTTDVALTTVRARIRDLTHRVEVDQINGLGRGALDRLTDAVMDLNTVEGLRAFLQTL